MSLRTLPVAATVLLAIAMPAPAAKLTVKPDDTAPPAELGAPMKALLDPKALSVYDGEKLLCTIWLRKEFDSKATAEQVKTGLTYRELEEGTVVGAVKFPALWTDFRKQKIKAGVYTLRMGWQPMDGDHMGTAPYNEFCLLAPATKDQKPEPIAAKALHELTAQSVGQSHPGIMLLYPNPKPADVPAVEAKDNNIQVLSVKRPVTAGGAKSALGFSLVVIGHTTAE